MNVRLFGPATSPPEGQYDADIIILSLERVSETIAAILSACGQTGASIHVFVLDQGSCPETLNHLAAVVAAHANVTLLAVARNLGVPAGRNILAGVGHGRIIVALDNDAEFAASDDVARMLAALDAEPGVAAIGCRIVTYTGGGDDLSSWGYPSRLLARAGEVFDTVTFVGAGHAIRRTAWDQAGGYDPKLFFCWEEFDFCLRAIALGWRIRYRGDIVIRHKIAPDQRVSWTAARWFYFVRNRIYIERKLGRTWFGIAPRVAGYLLKGVRNYMPVRTISAILAAAAMAPPARSRRMPPAGAAYLARNDHAHRGSLLYRLRHEVLGRLQNVASTAKR